ncbi:hypothetical protein FKV24_010705 [Lysobacter maris]|uniref:Uncharacterized protein n=1 Tax=Marilutibacter maris TaxID=1605891 RepID=A0A508ANS1_9GAMM|nr:hypothetical protein [Lysobacter maris]KAB8185234.1 hypothetical protein FKV24_010705 [Lysobacter maris]
MIQDGFLIQALTMMGYHLPTLLATVFGLAMLWARAPAAAPGRALAIGGTAMMLGSSVLGMLISIGQTWLIHNTDDGFVSISSMVTIIGMLSMLLTVVNAVGLGLLAWGASKAMAATLWKSEPAAG